MQTRKFHQLANLRPADRNTALAEGLELIAASVEQVLAEVRLANAAGAHRAAHLMCNIGREEAGKFLALIDTARDPSLRGAKLGWQLKRAGDHLCKLIYSQMADYSIGSTEELRAAIAMHRAEFYLDGPTEVEFVMPNDLLFERESAMYVDRVVSDGVAQWWSPSEIDSEALPQRSLRLIVAIQRAGFTTIAGLEALGNAWSDFDHNANTTAGEWIERSRAAATLLDLDPDNDAVQFCTWWWPMPLTRLDIRVRKVSSDELERRREELFKAWLEDQYGAPM